MKRLLATLLLLAIVPITAHSKTRTTILVPLDKSPTWRDLAFLAATPAAEAANIGGGSLIALDENGSLGPEFRDYIRRYKPNLIFVLDSGGKATSISANLHSTGIELQTIRASSAESASLKLSKLFWKHSKFAVVCGDEDYDSALLGAPLAARLNAPLIYATGAKLSNPTVAELKRLGVTQLVSIGSRAPKFKGQVVCLTGPIEIMKWVQKKGLAVSYLAAANPLDRENFTIRKLSLLGAQLAAGRQGLVAPLRYHVEWKRPFNSTLLNGALPSGVPASQAPAKAGTIEVGKTRNPFILTGDPNETNLRLSIDMSGAGKYSGPYVSGDQVEVDGKQWAVSLGTRTKFGQTDVHLTWPTAETLCSDLGRYYQALGTTPEHLCLVGFPDALPHAIYGRGGVVEEQASDLPYSLVNHDGFAQIGVGRVIAESVSYGSLYAARVLTYRDLLSPEWATSAAQAEWENSLRPLFENVGFTAPYRLVADHVPWQVLPVDGKGGQRAPSFAQDSPLARAALLAHGEHSWWRSLGTMFAVEAEVLMAPTIVESGGCGTTCLDREADNKSVVARMFRLGAVSFAGGSRELSAESQPMRCEFWNGILAGESLGQAHRRAQNTGMLIIRDRKEGPGGNYRYNTNVRMQFGDPALSVNIPAKPAFAPAHTMVNGDLVSVFAPGKWWKVKTIVPPDWTQWAGKDLYSFVGAGSYTMCSWGPPQRNVDVAMVNAEFKTSRKVTGIEQVTSASAPLGWRGTWHSTRDPEGTYHNLFAVQMIDFDQEQGKIISSVDRLDYRLKFE